MPGSNSFDSPFDSIAANYDRIFTGSCTGKAQRAAVWRETDQLFQTGQNILEMNCGTGVDAIHFARCGVSVLGFDQSSRMISVARNLVAQAGCEREVHLHQMAIEDMIEWDHRLQFDGAFSNFGGLNCVSNLSQVARDLARLVKPGGPVVLCWMSRSCLWEWVYYLGRFNFKKAFRRFRQGGSTAQFKHRSAFRVHYPGVRELIRCMDPHFHYVWHKAVGLTVPPTYLENWVEQHPRVLRISQSLDNSMSRWPVFRNLGDHCLAHFVRR
jgi:ubiquinone/menaquinone biosynthesis C-methylase UbiE